MKKALILILFFTGFFTINAGEFDDSDSFDTPASAFTALDIKGGFLFGLSDKETSFESRKGPHFGVSLISGISPYIGWGLSIDYTYTFTTIGAGASSTLTDGREIKTEVDVLNHQFDIGGQLGLLIPLNPIHLFAMLGPAYAISATKYDDIIMKDGKTVEGQDLTYNGLVFLSRIGFAFNLDAKTGLVSELSIRLGKLTNKDYKAEKLPNDGYSLRLGFRFIL